MRVRSFKNFNSPNSRNFKNRKNGIPGCAEWFEVLLRFLLGSLSHTQTWSKKCTRESISAFEVRFEVLTRNLKKCKNCIPGCAEWFEVLLFL